MTKTVKNLLIAAVIVALLALIAFGFPRSASAQVQDTLHRIVTDTIQQPIPDSVAVAVLPKGCGTIVACAKDFVLMNQLYLATGLTSLILFLLAQIHVFAQQPNWLTRVVQGLVGFLLSFAVTSWGGAPDPALNAFVSSALSLLLGGMIFRFGRTQPGNAK